MSETKKSDPIPLWLRGLATLSLLVAIALPFVPGEEWGLWGSCGRGSFKILAFLGVLFALPPLLFNRHGRRLRFIILMISMVLFGFLQWSCPRAVSAIEDTVFLVIGVTQGHSWLRSVLKTAGILGLAVLFGRFYCGWVCPIGAIQELLYRPKLGVAVPPRLDRYLKYGKYVAAILLIAAPLIWNYRLMRRVEPFKLMFRIQNGLEVPVDRGAVQPSFIPPTATEETAAPADDFAAAAAKGPPPGMDDDFAAAAAKGPPPGMDDDFAAAAAKGPPPGLNDDFAAAAAKGPPPGLNDDFAAQASAAAPPDLVEELAEGDAASWAGEFEETELIPWGEAASLDEFFSGVETERFRPNGDPEKTLTPWLLAFLLLILLASIFIERPFCRYLSPVGGLLAWLALLSPSRIRIDEGSCNSCMRCLRVCPTQALQPPQNKTEPVTVVVSECIACKECEASCSRGAIVYGGRFPKVNENPSEKEVADAS